MTRQRIASTLFLIGGFAFLVLALTETQGRSLRIALAVVFLLLGAQQRRGRQPPPGGPGA